MYYQMIGNYKENTNKIMTVLYMDVTWGIWVVNKTLNMLCLQKFIQLQFEKYGLAQYIIICWMTVNTIGWLCIYILKSASIVEWYWHSECNGINVWCMLKFIVHTFYLKCSPMLLAKMEIFQLLWKSKPNKDMSI